MCIMAFWSMYDVITPLILKNTFHLSEVLNGVVMAMDNVFALIFLPIFGIWSDKTNTRFGKRIPFIAIGTVIALAGMMFMPYADNRSNLTLFLIATCTVLLAMSFYRTPAVAIMPDITPSKLRSKGNAVVMLMGTVGAIYAMAMTRLLVKDNGIDNPNYAPLFLSIVIFTVIGTAVLLVTVKENKWAAEIKQGEDEEEEGKENANAGKKISRDKLKSLIFLLISVFFWFMSYNAVNSAFSRYSTEVMGLKNGEYANYMMIAIIAAVVSYLPVGIIAGKLGRKKVILAGVAGLALSFAACFFFTSGGFILKIFFVFIGISWGAINVNSLPMVVDIASEGDVGKYTGYYYAFSMAAQVLTPVLSGVFLQYVSYRSLFPYGVTFAVLALITMLFVKHGDIIENDNRSILERLDVDA